MSDLDKWYYFVEPADCGPVGGFAGRHIFMWGRDIVAMVKHEDDRYSEISDEDTLHDFLVSHWATEALDPLNSLPDVGTG
jgi:hypothetical protein